MRKQIVLPVLFALACGAGLGWYFRGQSVEAAAANRVYELRTYTAAEGKLPALLARFENHTLKLFEKHGIHNVAYWVPQDEPGKSNTLIYVVSHASRADATKNWDEFRKDPDWVKARGDSEVNGKLTTKVESVFLDPATFSPMK